MTEKEDKIAFEQWLKDHGHNFPPMLKKPYTKCIGLWTKRIKESSQKKLQGVNDANIST